MLEVKKLQVEEKTNRQPIDHQAPTRSISYPIYSITFSYGQSMRSIGQVAALIMAHSTRNNGPEPEQEQRSENIATAKVATETRESHAVEG